METFEEFDTLEVVLFRVETGDTWGGVVETGELGRGGETLQLLEVGGLEDQNLVKLSLEQAGMLNSWV